MRKSTGLQKAIDWCRIFLRGESVSNLPGTKHAQALLFPMETVFEHYVAQRLRREAPPEIRITTQERLYHLFEESPSGKAFPLRPDIVLRRNGRATEGPVIADTKWKLLCGDPSKNYGISTGDMYQMYAYQKRYAARTILLVYPRHGALASIDSALEKIIR